MADKCKHENISLYADQFRRIRCYVEFKPVSDEPDTEARLQEIHRRFLADMRDALDSLTLP